MTTRESYQQLRLAQKLPSPSKVALELVRLCHNDETSIADIVHVIETDPALSSELIKYSNSVLMGSRVAVTSIQKAAIKIGMNGVVNLALGFSLLSQCKGGPCQTFNYGRFWSKSLAQAVAAKAVAAAGQEQDPDELFACGLLAHIGELVLASSFPIEYGQILAKEQNAVMIMEEERRLFGLNHTELTAELFLDWGLPEKFSRAVRQHESYPLETGDSAEQGPCSEQLHLALKIAELCLLELPIARDFDAIEKLAEKNGVPGSDFPAFFDRIVSSWQEWGRLLSIRNQQTPQYREIKVMDIAPSEYVHYQPLEKMTILAVDDDPLTLQNLKRILKTESRHIITADNGEKALLLALDERPEMVITDWRMPQLDGLELCKILRRTSLTQHTYIIMLSSCEEDDELVEAFDVGADDYVLKPFTPKVLEARIRSGERLVRYQQTVNHDREIIQQYATQLSAANRKLQTMAMTDPLTGLPNRRSAMSRMKDVVAESTRFQEKLSCIMIDIDHFKKINDTHGHDIGDIVLRDIARIFSSNARSYDMVSRMGGEEFLVICGRSDLAETRQLAERLRLAVEKHETRLTNGQIIKVTISCGVAGWKSSYSNDNDLLKDTDRALYQAKQNGRNRVEVVQ